MANMIYRLVSADINRNFAKFKLKTISLLEWRYEKFFANAIVSEHAPGTSNAQRMGPYFTQWSNVHAFTK